MLLYPYYIMLFGSFSGAYPWPPDFGTVTVLGLLWEEGRRWLTIAG